ncbi:FMN adenylyltransferase [Cognatiyoonia koreensis]|uniref:Riboflavin biosynthesis protein n=1 Tax=Cognatiyoonia koreensis TaxID=364200 RepID=A0A1I0MYC6_9RHOB|nr:bifunctional riboflavin kinase/FAD synthetase [Cognatiyoonia koreensis]SEV93103.1 FMN adenylyltransferase [Cognatiyoonia koreensis]
MHIIRDTEFVDPSDRGAVAAIGNFDGVHLGHQSVIDMTRKAAEAAHAPLGIMTFEPHPRSYFAPELPPFRLMNAAAKASRMEKLGVEKLYEVPFNETLAALTPREFATVIIKDRLGLKHIVVGADFCFGKGRKGTVNDLIAFGQEMGFGVTIAPIETIGDTAISSTAIRTALSDGRPRDAAKMLGHWHRIEGEVIHGEQRGRELGYPTANMSIDTLHPPKFGVYAVKADVLDGPHKGNYFGAASIGVRPMFGENVPNCETFIFDFKGDLYGSHISIALIDFIRPELKFDDVPALIAQMETDCQEARTVLADV